MNWCKHVRSYNCNGTNFHDEWIITGDVGEWLGKTYGEPKFCPICGKQRPERKGLAEKLTVVECSIHNGYKARINALAKEAINHACEVVDAWRPSIAFPTSDLDQLKQALRDSI